MKNKTRLIISSGVLVILLIMITVILVRLPDEKTEPVADETADTESSTLQGAAIVPAGTSNQETTADNGSAPVPDATEKDKEKTSTSSISDITMIVNKNHSISASYMPDDLVTLDLPSTRDTQLRSVAAEALMKLFNAAGNAGLELYCCSGYRSYETQSELYDWNVSTYGADVAELVSARPGMSEHQLGLTMDLTSASVGFDLVDSFGTTAEGQFLKNNAYKYGFIIRYPEGKTDITGYAYEPWHIRYVGVDVATDIYNSGKTMEEYYNVN